MWSLAGIQAIDQLIRRFGPELLGLAVPGALCLWVGQLASAPGAHPLEVSGVGPQSANLGAGNRASCEVQACLFRIHRPGAEGGGAQEAMAAAESCLTSR